MASIISESGYAIRRELICDAHQWRTYAPCHDHGTTRARYDYRVVVPGVNGDGEPHDWPAFRSSGALVRFDSYSSAYSWVRAHS